MSSPRWDGVERRRPSGLYGRSATDLTGGLEPTGQRVAYRDVLSRRQHLCAVGLGWMHIVLAVGLGVYLVLPGHLPRLVGDRPVDDVLALVGLVVMVGLQLLVGLRTWNLTHFAARACDPVPMVPPAGLRVAVLTTIVPGKEPVELVMATLRAMTRIRHDGPLDVWLLDEGDDPDLRRRCEAMGVRHFSRHGRAEWNRTDGPFRARTKHGNHNAWRSVHEHHYDVVAQMDPDHVPYPNFLERSLGYFADPDTAFVVAPQVYGNQAESFVAKGAAELAYLFHGVIQRGGNRDGAPLLIGTNHLYRPTAFAQIGGYQDCIIEDHLTSMVIYATTNPATGNRWRGVYTPDVLAVGEGPATYSDFFSQQKRWAYGIWEIGRRHSPTLLPRLDRRAQKLSFVALQTHYPATAATWVGGIVLSALYLVGGVTVTRLPLVTWALLFGGNITVGMLLFQFLRRFNLVDHERRSHGLSGMALELITAPVYVAAAAAQLARRPLTYVVTAKGAAATIDSLRTFRAHLGWGAVTATSIVAGILLGHPYPTLYLWAGFTLAVCLSPLIGLVRAHLRHPAADHRRASGADVIVLRRRIGTILVAQGLISPEQLRDLLDRQVDPDTPWQRLGDLAVELGYVTPAQLNRALASGVGDDLAAA